MTIQVRVDQASGRTLYLVSSSFNRSGWALTQTTTPHHFGTKAAAQKAWDRHYPWDRSVRGLNPMVPVYEEVGVVEYVIRTPSGYLHVSPLTGWSIGPKTATASKYDSYAAALDAVATYRTNNRALDCIVEAVVPTAPAPAPAETTAWDILSSGGLDL